ncbi:MAG: replication protein [Lachnospiraceae bacterium]|nr:replication protein [Lachnospiraceae bacterium]
MNDRTQSRKWLLTFNNPEKFGFSHDNIKAALSTIKNLDYWCMCDEVGKEGTYHTHLFIYRQNTMRFQMIKNKFPTAHIDYCRGTTQENRDYIRKEGKYKDTDKEETNLHNTFEEFGECPIEEQGKRNDLNALYTMIKDGLSNYEILESNPAYMLQLEKIENCRQVILAEEFKHRFRELEVEYWFGKTDTGKSRTIMERYNYNVYRVTDYKHPFDNYKGQDVIMFEEFHSNIKIQDMLVYLDGYPLDLPCRYNNKVACYTKVYITSNMSLKDQYVNIQREYEETWNAFLRRINVVKTFGEKGLIRCESVHDFLYGFHDAETYVQIENYPDIPFQEVLDLEDDRC